MFKKLLTAILVAAMITTSAMTAFADNFTPSATQKEAPQVVEVVKDGKTYTAEIKDKLGNLLKRVPTGELIVTPIAKAAEARAEIKEMLISAYQQIKDAPDLGALTDTLQAEVKEISAELKIENLVVRDLFDVSVFGTYEELLEQEGNTIEVTFQLSADSQNLAAVLHNIEGTEWETVPEDRISRNDDNTVTVTFHSLSPVAFVYENVNLEARPGKKSPETGEANYAGLVAAGLMAAGAVAIVSKKNK